MEQIKRCLFLFVLVVVFCGELISQQGSPIDSLKKLLAITKVDTQRVNIIFQIIENESNDDVWPKLNREVLEICTRNEQSTNELIRKTAKRQKAGALNNEAYLFQVHSQFDSAIIIYDAVLITAKEINDIMLKATAYNNLGGIYYMQGNYMPALKNYFEALALMDKLNDKGSAATILNNIATIHLSQKDYAKALEYNKRCLKVRKDLSLSNEVAQSCNNIALVFTERLMFDSALYYYRMGVNSLGSKPNLAIQAALYDGMSNVYGRKFDFKSAYQNSLKSLSIRLSSNDEGQKALGYSQMGRCQTQINRHDSALYYLEKGYEIAKRLKMNDVIKSTTGTLYTVYANKKMFEKAYQALEEYKRLSDKTLNKQTQRAALQQSMQYEFEKKEALAKAEQDKKDAIALEEKNNQRTIIFSISVILVMVLALALFIFKGYRQKQKDNLIIAQQKNEVEHQKAIIEEHQKETIDSINYAKKIQYALLAQDDLLKRNIQNYFILFKPKDIVSGDFYWATEHHDKFYIAVCDSTGHGVPGAFMSLLNMGFLSEAIKEKNISKPNEVLNYVRTRLVDSLGHDGQKDGMDAILMCFDRKTNLITYSAANNEPILISNNQVIELEKDKMPVGKGEKLNSFVLYSVPGNVGDTLYLYTDGYADQFGGPKGKKYKYKQLNDLLLSISTKKLDEQKEILQSSFNNWKENLEQVDDVLIVGIKI